MRLDKAWAEEALAWAVSPAAEKKQLGIEVAVTQSEALVALERDVRHADLPS